jgi:hypothetical protein
MAGPCSYLQANLFIGSVLRQLPFLHNYPFLFVIPSTRNLLCAPSAAPNLLCAIRVRQIYRSTTTLPLVGDFGIRWLHRRRDRYEEGAAGAAEGEEAGVPVGRAAARTSRACLGKLKVPPVSSMTLTWQM